MQELYKHFSHSIAWNVLESILYQGILLGHQLLLFNVTDHATYGLIGAFFSITYLMVMITNFGLDVSITPFFTYIVQSKKHFKNFFLLQIIPECCILICLSALMMGTYFFFPSFLLSHKVNLPFLLLITGLTFFEGLKKTFRMILQLSFSNHKTALVEIATIIVYTSCVWMMYLIGFPITLHLIFIPMLIVSMLSNIVLFIFVLDYYKTLPDETSLSIVSIQRRVLHNRFFNFLNQLSHMIFSSNFLVPFFALFFGLNQAGILKLITTIAHTISAIFQKVFGTSSSILLSHLKNESLQTNQDAFFMITKIAHQILYGIILFFIINYKNFMYLGNISDYGITWSIICLFLFVSFSDNFFIAYEKFLITQEKTHYLCLLNLLIMGLMACVISHAHLFSQVILLLTIIIIRILAFSTLSLFSFYQWRIKPAFVIQPIYLIGSLIISITFFIITHII